MPAQARANPDLTLEEHRELFEEAEGVRVSAATMRAAPPGGWVRRSKRAPPRLRARGGRKGELAPKGRAAGPSRRPVFVDECGTRASVTRLRARAPRGGERAYYARVPRNRGKNTTLVASSMGAGGMGPCLAVAGSTTKKALFEAYAEGALAPSLWPGRVVVLDDLLGAHKGGRVRESVEGRGCELLFLPPCSPGFSPIEGRPSRRSRPRSGRPPRAPVRRRWWWRRWGARLTR